MPPPSLPILLFSRHSSPATSSALKARRTTIAAGLLWRTRRSSRRPTICSIATGNPFAAFNVLEAKLPALVSRAAPREATGSATGVYSSVQFLGTFFGGAAGGAIAQHAGAIAVLATCLAATILWLAVAWKMGEFEVRSAVEA